MERNFTKTSNTTATFQVKVQEADYQPRVEKKLKEYAKTARINGFRPGHVPMGHIKKLYGQSVLFDQVIEVVNEALQQHVKENKLNVVGDPQPSEKNNNINWESDKDFDFEFELGMASDFTVNLDKIKAISHYDIDPTEEKLEEAIEDMRNRFPNSIHPEEAEKGDFIFGDLAKADIEFTKYVGIPTDRIKEEAQFKFVGLEKGSKVSFAIESIFPDVKSLATFLGMPEEEAATLTGEYDFTVAEITRQAPAEVNQELFDRVLGEGKATNLEEFRLQLKDIIKENYNREADLLVNYELEKTLIDEIKIDLPDTFLKNWLTEINDGKFTAEQIEEQYPAFARGLRLDLIKSSVAEANPDAIKVEYEDVLEEGRKEIRQYMGQYSMQGMEGFIDKMVKDSLTKGNKNAQANFRRYSERAFGVKVTDFIKSQVKVDRKNINVDEFVKVAQTVTA